MTRLNHHLWWQLIILFIATALSVYVSFGLDEKFNAFLPETRLVPSIFNRKASGLTGLLDIAQAKGLVCQPFEQSLRELQGKRGTLVIYEPFASPYPFEIDQILNWVRGGNQLIYFDQFDSHQSRNILRVLGLKYKLSKVAALKALIPSKTLKESAYVKALVVSGRARILGGEAIIDDQDGAFLTAVSYGHGRILIGTDSAFCANRGLANKECFDNFQFFINWLSTAQGTIYFDERCHGFSNVPNLFLFLLQRSPGLVIFQFLLILVIAVVSSFQKFGEAIELKMTRQLSNLNFVKGLANTYCRANGYLAALEIIVQDFKTKLCRQLDLPSRTSLKELVSLSPDYASVASSNLLTFLADYERVCRQKTISKLELRQFVHRCDDLISQIKNASPSK